MKVHIVFCHPSENSLTYELKESYIKGLKASDINFTVSDYSHLIVEYRKLAVKILFRILIVKNIALAIFMALIGLFSMLSCID